MKRKLTLTLNELRELRQAVADVCWLPLEPRRYEAAKALSRKVERALAAAERRARQAVGAAG